MSNFTMMDWNSKWDWESFAGFCSKATESPKKVQLVDWTIVDDGEIDGGSINLSTGCGNTSASDGAHVSSSKSSLSASTDSSVKQPPNFKLTTFGGFSGTSPHLEASTGSVEPLIGLKLGKRTYFENCNVKSESFSVMPTPSTTSVKKTKSLGQNVSIPRCAVDRCNIDLSTAKEYHRKHRICDNHSKCAKVVVGGLERRFCQQCSRFHNLSEFDEKKRSCRRRLSDHNARCRKAQPETIHFNSARLSSPFYGERQPLSFLLNNSPLIHSRNSADTTWDNSTCNSKFTLTKGYRDGGTDEAMHVPGIKLPYVISRHANAQLLSSKSSIPEIFNPGSKGSVISSHLDAAHEYRRALSLLSKNTLDPCGPENMPLHHPTHENGTCVITQPTMHTIPEGVPLSSSELWLAGHKSPHPPLQSFVSNTNFQDIQLLATPYETDLYSSILN